MICAVCDDHVLARRTLVEHIRRFELEQCVECDVHEYDGAEPLLEDFSRGRTADIVFLDICMGAVDGMTAARALHAGGFVGSIVFCTTSGDYGVESYSVNADGYILKPCLYCDFLHVMERCRPRWERNRRSVVFNSNRLETTVFLRDIRFIESRGKGSVVHTGGGDLPAGTPIGEFAAELTDTAAFLRLGKSYVVNMNHIRDFDNAHVTMKDGTLLDMPVRDRALVKRQINAFRFLEMQGD